LLLAIAGSLLFSLNYDIPDIAVYFIPVYLILTIFVGVGFQALLQSLPPKWSFIAYTMVIFFPIFLVSKNYSRVDQSKKDAAGLKAKTVLEAIGENGVILAPGKKLPRQFFWYYIYGEHMNRNLYAIRLTPDFVKSYLIKNRPYDFHVTREPIPPGLDVFCMSVEQRRLLEKRYKFKLEKIRDDLYKVQRP
jgi:hypothetical protein